MSDKQETQQGLAPADKVHTVLLVEDEDFVRSVTTEVLEMTGYRVLTAASGDEGLQIYEKHHGDVDLLLTDVVMPGMNGPTLAGKLQERNARLKVLYMSGYTEVSVLKNAGGIESVSYLQKPFALDTLTAKVQEVLAEA